MNKNPDYARLFRGRPLRFVLPLEPKTDNRTNLVTLPGSSATASWKGKDVFVKPEMLCNLGCELPRFNYSLLGKPYRYFYAISSDVDLDNTGTVSIPFFRLLLFCKILKGKSAGNVKHQ